MLPSYLVLYGALYLAYGTKSAYLPAFLLSHGLSLEQIGLMLAIGTIVRIGAGPLIGRFADSIEAPKQVLSVAACLSGLIGLAYNFAFGFAPLLAVSIFHAAATASLAPLSDALSVDGIGSRPRIPIRLGAWRWFCRLYRRDFAVRSVDRAVRPIFDHHDEQRFLFDMAVSAMCIRSPIQARQVAEEQEAGVFGLLWRIAPYRRLVASPFSSSEVMRSTIRSQLSNGAKPALATYP